MVSAVLFDLGGVVLDSPFDGFARYEKAAGLPEGFVRSLNATNPDTNAWARFERGEIGADEFATLFEAEAEAAGGRLEAAALFGALSGQPRPTMVEAVRRCSVQMPVGAVTNNMVGFSGGSGRPDLDAVMALFHVVVESSKVGLRKPDPRIYTLACELLGVTPEETVFLDDLGVNLKPARALGMHTIKVGDPAVALRELESAVGFSLGS